VAVEGHKDTLEAGTHKELGDNHGEIPETGHIPGIRGNCLGIILVTMATAQ